jgi:hypothetical protein
MMMNSLIRSLLLAFLLIFSGKLTSQDAFSELDKVYGLDPSIYNGKKYSYFLPSGTGGNQFFSSAEYVKGGVVVKRGKGEEETRRQGEEVTGGRWYYDLFLNYDVYNQKLLLQYIDETGAAQIIEVSEAWLEGFSLGDKEFRYLKFDSGSRIFQVLGNGKYRVLYHWRKTFNLSNSAGNSIYTFSTPGKSRYVLIDGEIRSFGSKGSFIKQFDPVHKAEIKNYLKVNGLNLKKASDQEVTELINYISNLK